MNWQTLLISCCNVQPQKLIMFLWYSSFFFFNFYFVLGCSQLAMLWSFQVNSEGTQSYRFVVVQSLSRVQLFGTPWTAALQASLFITNSCSLLKLMSIESVMPSNHLIFCHPLLLFLSSPLLSSPPSYHQGLFQWVSFSHPVAKVLELQIQCQSFQWIFRTDFL